MEGQNLMTEYLVLTTSKGPAIYFGDGSLVFVDDVQRMCVVIDEHPELLAILQQSIKVYITDHIAFFLDAFTKRIQVDANPTHAAINILQTYNKFVYTDYMKYRSDVTEAITGNKDLETIIKHNHPTVNKFYGLG